MKKCKAHDWILLGHEHGTQTVKDNPRQVIYWCRTCGTTKQTDPFYVKPRHRRPNRYTYPSNLPRRVYTSVNR